LTKQLFLLTKYYQYWQIHRVK